MEWAPRSPDLTPLDFWLWEVLKHNCFKTPATSQAEIMERVTNECRRLENEDFASFEHVRYVYFIFLKFLPVHFFYFIQVVNSSNDLE